MKKQLVAGVIGAVMLLSAGVASAENRRDYRPMKKRQITHKQERQMARKHNLENRMEMQHKQIKLGLRRGTLLRKEAAFLKDNLRGIERSHRRARSDHRIDRVEWRRLNFMLERNGRVIRCLKDSPSLRR